MNDDRRGADRPARPLTAQMPNIRGVRIERGAMVLVVVIVVVLTCASCSQSGTNADSLRPTVPRTSTTTSAPSTTTTTTIAPATTTTFPVFGPRSFTVSGVLLSAGNWLTVGLHPTTAPVELQASSTVPLEVCPAGLDGGLNDSSWPPSFKFGSCIDLSSSGPTSLPPTDGGFHVAFAIKELSAGPLSPLALSVNHQRH